MTTERVQRQIDKLLDEVEASLAQRDWAAVHDSASAVLRLDPDNGDALAYLAAAQRDQVYLTDPSPHAGWGSCYLAWGKREIRRGRLAKTKEAQLRCAGFLG